jgi:hypothetical protein
LRCGDEGVVVSVWLSPGDILYEVQFRKSGGGSVVRAQLRAQQLEVVA